MARLPRAPIRASDEYYWSEAARWRGLSDAAMDALDLTAQARVVAHYEAAHEIAAVEAWEQERARRRKDRARARGTQ